MSNRGQQVIVSQDIHPLEEQVLSLPALSGVPVALALIRGGREGSLFCFCVSLF